MLVYVFFPVSYAKCWMRLNTDEGIMCNENMNDCKEIIVWAILTCATGSSVAVNCEVPGNCQRCGTWVVCSGLPRHLRLLQRVACFTSHDGKIHIVVYYADAKVVNASGCRRSVACPIWRLQKTPNWSEISIAFQGQTGKGIPAITLGWGSTQGHVNDAVPPCLYFRIEWIANCKAKGRDEHC